MEKNAKFCEMFFRISQIFSRNLEFFEKMDFAKGSENDAEFCERKKLATIFCVKNFRICFYNVYVKMRNFQRKQFLHFAGNPTIHCIKYIYSLHYLFNIVESLECTVSIQ